MMLMYVLKQIYYSTKTFEMRMNLAVLDWVKEVKCSDYSCLNIQVFKKV